MSDERSEGFFSDNISTVDITLDQVVTVTESRYPKLSFTKLLSDLGGSLGLWLGMGIIQICVMIVNLALSKFRA